jgi:hypothetical protein
MTDGPIIHLPRSEYRWLDEKVRAFKAWPLRKRVACFVLGILSPFIAFWLLTRSPLDVRLTFSVLSGLGFGAAWYLLRALASRPQSLN